MIRIATRIALPGAADSKRMTGNAESIPLACLVVPVRSVDATPSNAFIPRCFDGRNDRSSCPRSKPSQRSVSADRTQRSDFVFVFSGNRVRLECCVDPLRPPRLSGVRHSTNVPKHRFWITSGWPTMRPECELGLGACTPALLPASRRSTNFKPLGILKSPHATTACGAPSRSSDLKGQGRPPLQGGEGLNVV
jgi:hypothetical protein